MRLSASENLRVGRVEKGRDKSKAALLLDAEGQGGGVLGVPHDGGEQPGRLDGEGWHQAELADGDQAGKQVLPLTKLLAGGLFPLGDQPQGGNQLGCHSVVGGGGEVKQQLSCCLHFRIEFSCIFLIKEAIGYFVFLEPHLR